MKHLVEKFCAICAQKFARNPEFGEVRLYRAANIEKGACLSLQLIGRPWFNNSDNRKIPKS